MKTDKIWLLNIINKLISNPKDANDLIIELQKTEPDIAKGLHDISVILQKSYFNKKIIGNIITSVNEQVLQYAQNNYFYKIKTTNKDDLLDSLITSMNMLGEEINYSTVTKEYFTDIFNTIPDFVIVVTELGNIITASKNVLEELEETENTITNFSICELFSEKISFQKLLDSIDGKKIFHFKTIDGSLLPVTIKTANFIESNDQEIRRVFILSNISEIIQYQKELENALKKAEENDRLKSAFLANMSHEIRTPMNSILGFTELLKEPQLTEEEKDEYIGIIEKSGDRLLNTINDIIDISRIEAGEIKVTKTEVSVNKILDEQYNLFQIEAKSKGLELIYKPSFPDNELCIITDQHKLDGILTNLIKNAIKYTETGSITFGYAIKTQGEKDVVEFYVKDTGIGIPANRVDAIFNRFEQADIGDTRAFEGSGLGLAISKSYVEMLGGEIGVKSKEGEGSTFTFSIPYTKQLVKDAKKNISKKTQITLNHLSVIVAEDDKANELFYKKIFENKFKKITYTTTGKETIERFRDIPDTDIILMDIKMPDMNGYDATREIRKFNSDVVIIAQTAFGLVGDREKALEAGCDDYISKPIKKEILFEKIRVCLDKKHS